MACGCARDRGAGMNNRWLLLHFVLILLALFGTVNCGGGGGGSNALTTSPVKQSPPPPPLSIITTSVPDAVVTQPYSFTLQSTGGSGSKTWSISSGALPSGLSIDSASGLISGTATVAGLNSVSFRVQDSAGA